MILSSTDAAFLALQSDVLGRYERDTTLGISGRYVWQQTTSPHFFLHYSSISGDWVVGPSINPVHGSAEWAAITSGPTYAACPDHVTTVAGGFWRYWSGSTWRQANVAVTGGCPPSPPPPPMLPGYVCQCSDTCFVPGTTTVPGSNTPLHSDGVCDDGGPGSEGHVSAEAPAPPGMHA